MPGMAAPGLFSQRLGLRHWCGAVLSSAQRTRPHMQQLPLLLTRRHALATALLAAAGACTGALAQTPLKVGVLYNTPIADVGWNFQHHSGILAMEQAFPGKLKVEFVENVSEGPDAERVIRSLAQGGNQLIFTPSFGYMEPTLRVAAEFPKTSFANGTGYKQAPNVASYSAKFYEARYLLGVMAGHMSKTGVAGYVAAFPIPEVLQGINAFTLGMRSVNPKAETRVVWVNSWFDPPNEAQATTSLINLGADVISNHTNSPASVIEAEAKGKYSFGYQSDMKKFAPKGQLSAVVHNWGPYYTEVARAVLAGTWKGGNRLGSYAEGFIEIAPMNPAVPKDVQDKVRKLEADLKAGKLAPFNGPFSDNENKERVAAGKTLAEADIGSMNYYVAGVVGKVPK
jgi:basic membrane protein A and related proteins